MPFVGTRGLSAEEVWRLLRAGNQPAGSFGEFLDVAVSSRADAAHYTATRASYLDLINTRLDVAVSSRADATYYTATRAARLDNLDVAVSSRLIAMNKLFDSTYPCVDVRAGSTVDTFGSWAELVASVGVGRVLYAVVCAGNPDHSDAELELGVGAAGSESTILRYVIPNLNIGATASASWLLIPVGYVLPNNARLAARLRARPGGVVYRVSVWIGPA
ncbi:MAG: hypothetical protein QXI60_03360 [Thermofilaceae archaeon]